MITSWESLPLVLHCKDMADLLDVKLATIWRKCGDRTMWPPPVRWTKPYRWSRESVRRQLENGEPYVASRYFKKGALAKLKVEERARQTA